MEEIYLYKKIAGVLRRLILEGQLKPGDRVQTVREMCSEWDCTPGTIQRAYQELVQEGLLVSQAGRGTRVSSVIPLVKSQVQETLRRANLVNRSESFLLEAITAGYSVEDIQQAMDIAMDRWRTGGSTVVLPPENTLRFSGSHDWVVSDLAHAYFGKLEKSTTLHLNYVGSLSGLMALAEGTADIAGCHLWDNETGEYNLPFVRRLLPGKETVVVTLAERRQGLIVRAGNPLQVRDLNDLTRKDIRFVNRQPGSGTRVWLDVMLSKLKISPSRVNGYERECQTHSEVAREIAEGTADTGIGLETAANSFGLDFIFLNKERYDLVMLEKTARLPSVQKLLRWLSSPTGREFVRIHPGYESDLTSQVVSADNQRNT